MVQYSQIDQLIEDGLAPIKKLAYGRIVLADVATGITSMVYRNLAIEMFSKIVGFILNDSILYNRMRQLLLQSHPMTAASFESLVNKSEKSNISLDTILEVYDRGFAETPPPHMTQGQHAFNRVNSFIAGGKARELDADLFEMEMDPHKREVGTDSLLNTYINDTPGQSKTLKTIKKYAVKK